MEKENLAHFKWHECNNKILERPLSPYSRGVGGGRLENERKIKACSCEWHECNKQELEGLSHHTAVAEEVGGRAQGGACVGRGGLVGQGPRIDAGPSTVCERRAATSSA